MGLPRCPMSQGIPGAHGVQGTLLPPGHSAQRQLDVAAYSSKDQEGARVTDPQDRCYTPRFGTVPKGSHSSFRIRQQPHGLLRLSRWGPALLLHPVSSAQRFLCHRAAQRLARSAGTNAPRPAFAGMLQQQHQNSRVYQSAGHSLRRLRSAQRSEGSSPVHSRQPRAIHLSCCSALHFQALAVTLRPGLC